MQINLVANSPVAFVFIIKVIKGITSTQNSLPVARSIGAVLVD